MIWHFHKIAEVARLQLQSMRHQFVNASQKKIYLTLYINNIKLIESDKHVLDEISHQIAEHFQIMNKDQIHHYLSMKIEINCQAQDSMICLSQKIYIKQLLEQFDMQNCLLMSTLIQHSLQILDQLSEKYIKFTVDNYQSLIKSL